LWIGSGFGGRLIAFKALLASSSLKSFKALKVDLKRWNEQEFGNVEFRKKMHMEELCTFDRLEEQHGLSPEEKERKCGVIRDLENSIFQEEISWRQKSRVLWLKKGVNALNFFIKLPTRIGGLTP
jgi:hypothetical protein